MAKITEEHKDMGFLPPEILRQIIQYIAQPEILVKGKIKFNYTFDYKVEPQLERRLAQKDIHNLRLVNRQWHDAASASLLPILKIRLNEESLASAERLSKSPRIAAGIKAVQLILGYYPGVLIADRVKLYSVLHSRLRDLIDTCPRRRLALTYCDESEEVICEPFSGLPFDEEGKELVPDTLDPVANGALQAEVPRRITVAEATELYNRAEKKCRILIYSSEKKVFISRSEDPEQHAEQDTRLVDQAIERIHQRYYDQQDLIRTTRFATEVATIMNRLSDKVLLCFSDADEEMEEDRLDITPATNILDDSRLVDTLSGPFAWSWRDITGRDKSPRTFEQEDKVGLSSVALLCDVPVAMAQIGCKLRRIQMYSWPMHRGAQLLQPEKCSLTTSWQQLREALDALEMIYFRPVVKPFNDESRPATTNQRDAMVEYLRACIAAPTLIEVSIKSEGMRLFMSNDVYELDVQDVFSAVQSRSLVRFSLGGVSTKMQGLEHVVGLLNESTKKCRLRSVQLLDGSWYGIVETLRSRIGESARRGTCHMHAHTLISGDEEMKQVLEKVEYWNEMAYGAEDTFNRVYPDDVVSSYVECKMDWNPFGQSDLKEAFHNYGGEVTRSYSKASRELFLKLQGAEAAESTQGEQS